LLAGKAAYRVGAGLVTLAVPAPLHAPLAGHFPEATWLLLPHEQGVIADGAQEIIYQNSDRATAFLIGPGWGQEETTRLFLSHLLDEKSGHKRGNIGFMGASDERPLSNGHLPPLVVDADGLKLLTKIPDWAKKLPKGSILTPHPGEMAILTGEKIDAIQARRVQTAEKYAQEWGQIVVLKGAYTVIAEPGGETMVIPVATPALARAGTGDVLAGMIAGLLAQKMPAFHAAVTGAWLHAACGQTALNNLGNAASVLAGDVLAAIPQVITEINKDDLDA
jgi:NAD(P)H-hydrate epimerase